MREAGDPRRESVRQRQKRRMEVSILDAARTLFAAHGFENTTIRAVADKAGIGLGTVFNYFPDKSSLLVAAFIDDLAKVHAEALVSCSDGSSFLDTFVHYSKHYYAYYANNIPLSRILIKEMLFIQGAWGEKLKAKYAEYINSLATLLTEDEEIELFHPQDALLAAECLFSN